MLAWAGVPVQDQDDRVMGVLWVADRVARQWSASDIAMLETLAQVAWSEVSLLRAALARSAGRAALARILEESLLPPRLPYIPGLQVAARYAAAGTGGGTWGGTGGGTGGGAWAGAGAGAGTGGEVLADFCDVFPSANRTWGIVVGDVCGKGPAAAKRTALADLNQVLLDWPTDDPRFLTAIYAAVRLVPGGTMVRISCAGHPLALVRTANGQVREFGRPGDLLGVLAHPEAIQLATLSFGGGRRSDDTVALVMQVPRC
jgi:hypothetical protein